ncbi:MAG TPA: hypothetical protein VK540_18170 [Polyangiaceae bacterium]|nr:hypothetical protein [Polyangiaceae bacterium]
MKKISPCRPFLSASVLATSLIAACGELPGGSSSPPPSEKAFPLRRGDPLPVKKVAFVLVDVGAGINVTSAQAIVRLMGPREASTVAPLRDYFKEASYGRQDIVAEVVGPLSYAQPSDTSACAKAYPLALAETLRPMVAGTFDAYFWYLGSRVPTCTWNGLASLGTLAEPTRDTWYNGMLSGCSTLIQEPGHSFGLYHSSSLRCGASSLTDDLQGCSHSEYGDTYDAMGQGCGHINGYHKAYLGWIAGCNFVQVRRSGTFNLLPFELPCDGAQVLQIPMPKTRPIAHIGMDGVPTSTDLTHYYVELRTNRGIGGLAAPSVQIRVSGRISEPAERSLHSWILDMIPSTSVLDGLADGTSFTDPAGGLTIRVEALSADGATVTVELASDGGGPLCLGGDEAAAPGPAIESCTSEPTPPDAGSAGRGGNAGVGGPGGAGTAGSAGDAAGTGGASGSTGGGAAGAGTPEIDAGEEGPGSAGADGGCGCALARSTEVAARLRWLVGLLCSYSVLRRWHRRRSSYAVQSTHSAVISRQS